MGFKVVIADNRHADYQEERSVLKPIAAEIVVVKSPQAEDIVAAARNADGLIVNLPPITAEVIGRLEQCRVISRYGVGYDNVDIAAAAKKGVWVANVPDFCGEDVSDQAMALFLSCVRKVAQRDRQVRKGTWDLGATSPEYRIKNKTFVFFGYGMIARVLHRKLSGFQLGRVLVYDPYVDEAVIRKTGAEKVDLDTALTEGDYFSIHLPVTDETRGLFNEKLFRRMKPTAMVINTSRGPIVQEDDLCRGLTEGWIDSAGLDVFQQEPVNADNPLLKLENITVSGHVGFYTEESIVELKTKAAENVRAVLTGDQPPYPVNRPAGS